ncbi:MAG: GGDEF domain-containing phosphodiesterase [Lachnospiraceae bacterium]|nr:GGDEF domain-containing phosphodiesterase [Lachnospiraceae bacterium]
MYSVIYQLVPPVLFSLSLISLVLAFVSMLMQFHYEKLKSLIVKLELGTAVFLLCMAITAITDQIPSPAYRLVSILTSDVTVILAVVCLYLYHQYLTLLFMSKGHFKKLPGLLLAGFVLSGVWFGYSLVTLATGNLFTIDPNNTFHAGPLYHLQGVFPLLIEILELSFILRHRNRLEKNEKTCLFLAHFFLMSSSCFQFWPVGCLFCPVSIFLAAVCLYCHTVVQQNAHLQKAAYTEIQTGLPNAYGYMYVIDKKIAQGTATNYNAYYLDVRGVGALNRQYGKEITDEVLSRYTQKLSTWFLEDELLGRLGGNLYVALARRSRNDEFLRMISDIPVEIVVNQKKITLHMAAIAGCYEIPANIKVAGQVFGKISSAVAYAKNVAKVPYVFLDAEMEQKIYQEKVLLQDIQNGLQKGEFVAFYQPQVDTVSGNIYGCEALVRWEKDGKLIPPCHFIPAMEKNNLICSLDFCILENVCRDLREWLDKGLIPPKASVNLSRKNLGNPHLVEDIMALLEKYAIPSHLLQIEVTETTDDYPLTRLREVVDELHTCGISVAIDDFGTGSSSISLLKEIHFDLLKIDKTFVEYRNEKEKNLLAYIIEMSKAIDIHVLAEGVEDPLQVQLLKDMDCTLIQGYVFDRPLQKVDFVKRLEQQSYCLNG